MTRQQHGTTYEQGQRSKWTLEIITSTDTDGENYTLVALYCGKSQKTYQVCT